MQPKLKIRKGDEVIILTGKDKGKKGQVLEVLPTKSRVKVQGINLVKRHRRPTQTSPGGIDSFEVIETSFSAIRKEMSSPSIAHGPAINRNFSLGMLSVIIFIFF